MQEIPCYQAIRPKLTLHRDSLRPPAEPRQTGTRNAARNGARIRIDRKLAPQSRPLQASLKTRDHLRGWLAETEGFEPSIPFWGMLI